MRRAIRELWEISKIWWLVVPGGVLGVVAILQAIKDVHGKSVWFWGFWAVTALLFAGGWRLRGVLKERDKAEAALGEEGSRDAVAHRIDRFAREIESLRAEIPPDHEGPGPLYSDEQEAWMDSAAHFSERVTGELRQSAPGFVPYWRTELGPSSTSSRLTKVRAEAEIDFGLDQLRHIAERLRTGHDDP
jgi:hypothetical protein